MTDKSHSRAIKPIYICHVIDAACEKSGVTAEELTAPGKGSAIICAVRAAIVHVARDLCVVRPTNKELAEAFGLKNESSVLHLGRVAFAAMATETPTVQQLAIRHVAQLARRSLSVNIAFPSGAVK